MNYTTIKTNNMENRQTAVQWLINMLDIDTSDSATKSVINESLQMEQNLMVEFAQQYAQECVFATQDDDGKFIATKSAKAYYTKTLKTK